MAMRANIKFNSATKDQAKTLSAALKQSFTPSMLHVVLEEIAYVPNPVRSMDLVFQDLNTKLPADQVEIVLLDWTPCPGEPSMLKIQDGRMVCNLSVIQTTVLSSERIIQEAVNLLLGVKAKEFAKIPVFTSTIVESHTEFYMASRQALNSVYQPAEVKSQGFKKRLIVNQNYEIWIQMTEFKRIRIPLKRGWETALFLFILMNENGFSFQDFRIKHDSGQLAYFYSLTKPNSEEIDIIREIKYRIENDQMVKFFSPHFSRIRNAIGLALGKYPEVLEELTISTQGPVKNIFWDRSAIIWE